MARATDEPDAGTCDFQTFDLSLSRRAFLGSAGSVVVALPSAGQAQQIAPRFVKQGEGSILLTHLGYNWRIDPKWFHYDATSVDTALSWVSASEIRVSEGLFAGTNVAAEFSIKLVQTPAGWTLVWRFGNGGGERRIDLDDWFAGRSLPPVRFRTNGRIASDAIKLAKPLMGSLSWPMAVDFSSGSSSPEFDYRLGSTKGRAQILRLRPYETTASNPAYDPPQLTRDVRELLPDGMAPSAFKMRAELDRMSVREPPVAWWLGVVDEVSLQLAHQMPLVTVEVAWRGTAAGFGAVWRFQSRAKRTRLIVGISEKPRSLYLRENAEYIEFHGRNFDAYGLVAALDNNGAMVQAPRFAATVRGGSSRLSPRFRNTKALALDIELLTLHVRGEDSARYDIDFRSGPTDLDRSAIILPKADAGVPALLTIGRYADVDDSNHLYLGPRSRLKVELNRLDVDTIVDGSPILRVRRHDDALDLGFQFHDHRLELDDVGTNIHAGPDGHRAVRFHPQHLLEDAFDLPAAQSALRAVTQPVISFFSGLVADPPAEITIRRLGSSAAYGESGVETKLARTRASGASRLAFQKLTGADSFALTVSSLTNWEKLRLNVMPRIDDAKKSLDEQIASLKITTSTDRSAAIALVNAQFRPPHGDETALELVTGLVFSPDSGARFRVPRGELGTSPALWTAELELVPIDQAAQPQSKVRAIWADGLRSNALIGSPCVGDAIAAEPPFITSINGRDRAEIVLQSSALGLAALRALDASGQDTPKSQVRLPKEVFAYLDQRELPHPRDPTGPKFRQEGVMSPAPFDKFGARLTGFGTSLDAEWTAEPVAPWVPGVTAGSPQKFFNRAFAVERYVHRTSLGSDMFAEVVYKGFLFPYGFRVALVKITEREPHVVAPHGAMMPLIQRFYIVPKPVPKGMAGLYQPFSGREIPMRHGQLLGERSPELDGSEMDPPKELDAYIQRPPTTANDSCSNPVRKPVGQIFWPKLKKTRAYLEFEFEADKTGTRRAVPMMFLDNAAVHDPETVRAVIAYYNLDAARFLRTEKHFGGRTIFADPNESGDTSFETDSIVLKARSRMIETAIPATSPRSRAAPTDPDLAQFQMDAFMEGADEPPFYPLMEEARIKVPPLDRLLGSPQGYKTVGYNAHYIRNGFDARANASEIYLNFLSPDGVMQLGGRGEISGGVSQTPTPIAGISRANAIVGAPAREIVKTSAAIRLVGTLGPAEQREAAMPPVGADARTPWDLSDVVGNRFDPAKFFKLPKLLGVIEIEKAVLPGLMAAQPRLRESYDYAVAKGTEAEDKVLNAFQTAAKIAAAALDASLVAAEDAVRRYLEADKAKVEDGTGYPNLKRFYPELTDRLEKLSSLLRKASTAPNLGAVVKDAKAISEAWRLLKGSVDAIIANPTPEPIRDIVTQLRTIVDTIQSKLGADLKTALSIQLKNLVQTFLAPVLDAILDQVKFDVDGRVSEAWLYEAFFGLLPVWDDGNLPTRADLRERIDALVAKPEDIPIGLTTAPLALAFTIPVLRVLIAARRFESAADHAETFLVGQLAENAFGILEMVTQAVASLNQLATAAQSAATTACAVGAEPVVKMLGLAIEGLPSAREIGDGLIELQNQLIILDLPNLGNSHDVDMVRQRNAGLRVAIGTLATQIKGLVTVREALPATNADRTAWCKSPGRIPASIADLWRWRGDTLRALEDCVGQALSVGEALNSLGAPQAQQALAALSTARRRLATLALGFTLAKLADQDTLARSKLAQRLQPLPASVTARLADLPAAVFRAGQELNAALPAAPANITDAVLADLAKRAVAAAALEQRLLALATDYSVLPGQILPRLNTLTRGLASGIAKPLIELHRTVQTVGDDAVKSIQSASDIVAMLTGPLLDRLIKACGYIQWDIDLLDKMANDPARADDLLRRWRAEQPGLVHLARTLLEIFSAVARGQIGALFDLAAARRAVEDALRRLVPSRVTLTYEWDTDLERFPSGDPIFTPDRSGMPRWPNAKDLNISTRIEVDLLDPRKGRSVEVVGRLQPFKLDLLGKSLHFVTIYFTGTEFRSKGGGSPDFTTKISRVEIGQKLKFLNALQDFMQSKNGFVVAPSISPPGVEIGYSIGAPKIMLGGVTFLNVAFGVSVLLPFDSSSALFRFAFASRAQPFGIIVAPYYYGGGFVALTANAREIVAFEISLEFGAATDITFGPMTGRGRVSTGMYMIADQRGRRFEGFVHALGEGQIACFGISVNIAVTVRPKGSSMQGTARYSYSFRVGIAEVSYSFTAEYEFKGGGGAGLMNIAPGDAGVVKASRLPDPDPPPPLAAFELKYKDKQQDWAAYRSHFISDWPA